MRTCSLLVLAFLVPCTAGADEGGRPDARLTYVQSGVDVLAPTARPAQRDDALSRGDRVRTAGGGAAEVTFSDSTRIQLGERSLLLVAGDPPGTLGGVKDTMLLSGSLRVFSPELGPAAGQKRKDAILVVLLTPSAKISLGEGSGVVTAGDGVTWVSSHRGTIRVSAGGKTVRLRAGFATRVEMGRRPAPPQGLPPPPTWRDMPRDPAGEGMVSWRGEPAEGGALLGWHVEVARDERFNDVVLERQLPLPEPQLGLASLPQGRYLLRVSGIDGERRLGPASPTLAFSIEGPIRRPVPSLPMSPVQRAPAQRPQVALAPQAPLMSEPAPAPLTIPAVGKEPAAATSAASTGAKAGTATAAEQGSEETGEEPHPSPNKAERRLLAAELGIVSGLYLGNIGIGTVGGGVSLELGLRFRLRTTSLVLSLRPSYEHAAFDGRGATARDLLTITTLLSFRLRAPEKSFVPYLSLAPQFHFDWLHTTRGAELRLVPGLLLAAGAQFRVGEAGAIFVEAGYRLTPNASETGLPIPLGGEVLSCGYRLLL